MTQTRKLRLLCMLAMWCFFIAIGYAQTAQNGSNNNEITLRFIDEETLSVVQDVSVIDLNHTHITNKYGIITLPNSLKKNDIITIKSIGYKTLQLHLQDIQQENGIYVVQMKPETKQLKEVVVRGIKNNVSVNAISSQLNSKAIESYMGKSLASLLEQVSGVSSIQTGTSTAKPVIQGMYGNRILMVNNGARQTGQQWGLDHSPEIDKNASATIKVIKGAESVRYGSEALGGIVVMEQKALPYQETKSSGSISTLYGTNGKRYNMVATIEGTAPFLRDIAWRLQGTYINSGDAKTANYLLNNTGYRENNVSTTIGYKHSNFKIEGFYSFYHRKEGVLFSSQMGSEELLQERITLGKPVYVTPFSRTITYPFHDVNHHTAIGKVYFDGGKLGNYFYQAAFQSDNREENRMRRAGPSSIPVVSMHLNSFQHLLKWDKTYNRWNTELGASYLHIRNKNQAGTGIVPIIPNYTEYDFGTYFIQKYMYKQWNAELGVRFDNQETQARGYDYTSKPYGKSHSFSNLSYNLGVHYTPSAHWSLTSNLGLAWRAPHVYELYSNGSELGSGMFTIGNDSMRSEQSTKWITSATYKNNVINLKVDAYLQWINGYIYDEPSHQLITVISGAYPLFRYKQTNAFFRGIDVDLKLKPTANIEYHLLTSFIKANEQHTHNYLPYIPSTRIDHNLTWHNIKVGKASLWIQAKHRFVAKQNRFNPESDLISFTPPAYHLFGGECGAEYKIGATQKLRFVLAVDNLLNKEYKEYTNRSRYYAHDMGRDIRCTLSWYF